MNWLLFLILPLETKLLCRTKLTMGLPPCCLFSGRCFFVWSTLSQLWWLAFDLCFLRSPSTKLSVMNNLYTNVRPRIPRGRLGCVASVGAGDAVIDASTSSAVVPDFYLNKEERCEVWFQITSSRSLSLVVPVTLPLVLCKCGVCLFWGLLDDSLWLNTPLIVSLTVWHDKDVPSKDL